MDIINVTVSGSIATMADGWRELSSLVSGSPDILRALHHCGHRLRSDGTPSPASLARLARWGDDGAARPLTEFAADEGRRPHPDRTFVNELTNLAADRLEQLSPRTAAALIRALRYYDPLFAPGRQSLLQPGIARLAPLDPSGCGRRLTSMLSLRLGQLPDYFPARLTVPDVASLTRLDQFDDNRDATAIAGHYWRARMQWDEVLGECGRALVVLGDPGFGKSTVLRAHALRLLDSDGVVPVYTHLGRFAARLAQAQRMTRDQVCDALIDAMLDEIACDISAAERDRMRQQVLYDSGLDVVLDGWDEVVDAALRNRIEFALRTLAPPGRLIVASRITGYTRPVPEASEFVIAGLDDDRVTTFVNQWYRASNDPDARQRLQDARAASDELRMLMHVPVLAGFAALIAQHSKEVPTRRAPLYARAIELLLSQVWKKDSPSYNPPSHAERADRIDVAAELAWLMGRGCTEAEPQPWQDEVIWRSGRELFRAAQRAHIDSLFAQDGLLVHAASTIPKTGIVTTLLDSSFVWLHRTIHEYLAARHLATMTIRDREAGFAEAAELVLQKNRWTVVLGLYTGVLHDRSLMTGKAWFEHLWKMHKAGDPGKVYVYSIFDCYDDLSRPWDVSESVIEFAFSDRRHIRYRISPERAVQAALDNLRSGSPPPNYEHSHLASTGLAGAREVLVHVAQTDVSGPYAAAELATLDRKAAQQIVVRRLITEQCYFPPHVLLGAPPDLTEALLEAYVVTPWPRKIRLAQALAATGHAETLELLRTDGADARSVVIAWCAMKSWPHDQCPALHPWIDPRNLLAMAATEDPWTQATMADLELDAVIEHWYDLSTEWMKLGACMDLNAAFQVIDQRSFEPDGDALRGADAHSVQTGLTLAYLHRNPTAEFVPDLVNILLSPEPEDPYRWPEEPRIPLRWIAQYTLAQQDPSVVLGVALAESDTTSQIKIIREGIVDRQFSSHAVEQVLRCLHAVPDPALPIVIEALIKTEGASYAHLVDRLIVSARCTASTERAKSILDNSVYFYSDDLLANWPKLVAAYRELLHRRPPLRLGWAEVW